MAPRTLSKVELRELGLSNEQVDEIVELQSQKPIRRYKYVAFLTPEEAVQASKLTKQDFVRATEYKPRRRKR
ncbi:MAG TPA: hypothetical protein G4O08_02845 [Anaerolineae bacterium]|nr:hypothetical protein [Anaerolineae bacterium]